MTYTLSGVKRASINVHKNTLLLTPEMRPENHQVSKFCSESKFITVNLANLYWCHFAKNVNLNRLKETGSLTESTIVTVDIPQSITITKDPKLDYAMPEVLVR